MSFVFDHSCLAVKPELDLFSELPTQASIDEGLYVEHLPTGTLDDQNPIKFTVSGDSLYYIDTSNCYLHLETKITKADGKPLGDNDICGPVNLTAHSLFKQCDIYLNDCLISDSNNLYHYRSYLETLLSFSQEAKKSHLTSSLYYKDKSGKLDDVADANTGLVQRRGFYKGGRIVPLIAKLHSDIFFTNRYLINGVDLKIKLLRNSDQLVLMATGNSSFKLSITKASLLVRKVKINEGIQLKQIEIMEKNLQPATYPLRRVTMKSFIIPSGLRSYNEECLFQGLLPKRIIIGMVASENYEGSYAKNPFNFTHNKLEYCALNVNGNLVPRRGITTDFENKNSLQGYLALLQSTGKAFTDQGVDIDRVEFEQGYSLIGWDLTPDMAEYGCNHIQNKGTIRLELKFGAALPTPINVIVYSEYDSSIKIDKNRMVMANFYA